ncbi:unnamed protein product [Oppiella nova]|uniref:Glutathione S-transferase n=1 Tax=Oppiella nova TaxID=334625 RepID=A0A7R9LQ68_9ACAR|nr:unnamed protein product [Oppiella nova]CAG2165885.1 unnamed protein product [Oppiella nova]
MPIDLYYGRFSGPCRAVLMTVRQLNIPVNLKQFESGGGDNLKPEFLKLNPAHTVPTIDDNGFSLWESRAIMQYLCNQYAPDSQLYPSDPKKRALVDRSLNMDMSLAPEIGEVARAKLFTGVDPPEDKVTTLMNTLKLLDQIIGGSRYVAGDELTIADLSLLANTVYLDWVDLDISEFANYKRWYTTLKKDLPYFNEINAISREEKEAMVAKARAAYAAKK